MKVYAVSGLAFLIGIGLAFAGTKIMTPAKQPEPPFNFDTAKRPDRMAFLSDQAAPIGASIEASLGGVMEMDRPLLNPETRRITYRIHVGARVAASFDRRALKMQIYPKLCPDYVESPLGKQGVAVIQKFVARNGTGTLMKIVLSNRVCSHFI